MGESHGAQRATVHRGHSLDAHTTRLWWTVGYATYFHNYLYFSHTEEYNFWFPGYRSEPWSSVKWTLCLGHWGGEAEEDSLGLNQLLLQWACLSFRHGPADSGSSPGLRLIPGRAVSCWGTGSTMEGAPLHQNCCPEAKPDTPEDPERLSSVSAVRAVTSTKPQKAPLTANFVSTSTIKYSNRGLLSKWNASLSSLGNLVLKVS